GHVVCAGRRAPRRAGHHRGIEADSASTVKDSNHLVPAGVNVAGYVVGSAAADRTSEGPDLATRVHTAGVARAQLMNKGSWNPTADKLLDSSRGAELAARGYTATVIHGDGTRVGIGDGRLSLSVGHRRRHEHDRSEKGRPSLLLKQAWNEPQIKSPRIAGGHSALHSLLADGCVARWIEHPLEMTHGYAKRAAAFG